MANAASGVAVNVDCKLKFLELKAKRAYRFIIFKLDEKLKQIIVEKLGDPSQSYEDFTASLPANECRYAIYVFDFVTEENCQKSKIIFIAWSPATARIRSKMLYASSKDRFKRELDGIQVELQATDPTEMGLDVIREQVQLEVKITDPTEMGLDVIREQVQLEVKIQVSWTCIFTIRGRAN